jgi:hypothetical protein
MKYFAAVACGAVASSKFLFLDTAPSLTDTKCSVLLNIPEIELFKDSVIDITMVRLEHPHIPLTYILLTDKIDSTVFE